MRKTLVFLPKMYNLYVTIRKYQPNIEEVDIKYLPRNIFNVKVMKIKERLKNCHRQKKTKGRLLEEMPESLRNTFAMASVMGTTGTSEENQRIQW